MKKAKDLGVITLIYLLAYAVGLGVCFMLDRVTTGIGMVLLYLIFDVVATVVTFVFSVLLHNSSVYDAYWSLTPMVMSVWLFVAARAFSVWQILFLLLFNLWSFRLTANWVAVFTDFSYEDWRYRKFRDENPPLLWWIINFCGIHMVPTLVVFAGMLPLFEIARHPLGVLALPGMALILCGVALEFFADRQMHAFLKDCAASGTKTVCRRGLWNLSRHPNYLGEITVWVGTYFVMLPFAPAKWFYLVGAAGVALLFNVVSIPLMEKRQMSRRPEYATYRQTTSRLFLWPPRTPRA